MPAQFNFIPKTNQKNYCKEWLRVVPSCGIILPGEVIEINVSILVTSISAPSLHSNRDTLDDFIVLHLEGGKDHYVKYSFIFILFYFYFIFILFYLLDYFIIKLLYYYFII